MSKKAAGTSRNRGARGAATPRQGTTTDSQPLAGTDAPDGAAEVVERGRDEKDVSEANQPGFDEGGMNRQRRDAQKAAEKAIGGTRKATDAQSALEATRIERGRQIRGTGDMPAPVRGATRPVEGAGDHVGDVADVRDAVTERYKDVKGGQSIKVRATRLGYYDDVRRRTGDVFSIRPPYKHYDEDLDKEISVDEFSRKWMVRVDGKTPERKTTGKEELRRKHDEELAARAAGGGRGREADRDVTGSATT